jgi:hypothetical protein
MIVSNTLAYYDTKLIISVKRFIVQAHDVIAIKLVFSVIAAPGTEARVFSA